MKLLLSQRRPRGAILVFALLCSAVAVLGLTCWVATVAARSRYIDEQYQGAKRRMARENGHVLATRYVQARVLPGAAGGPFSRGLGTYYDNTDNYEWGGVKMAGSWSGSTLASITPSRGINRISYGDASGFGLRTSTGLGYDLPLQLLDGSQEWAYRWQARSGSPALAGELLVIHSPGGGHSVAVNGSLNVHGRAFFWAVQSSDSYSGALAVDSYSTPGPGLAALADSNAVVSNYPTVFNLTWAATTGTPVAGVSNVIWDDNTPGNSLKNKALDNKASASLYQVSGSATSSSSSGYSSDGTGTVTIDLSNPTLDVVDVQDATTLELTGQDNPAAWDDANTQPAVLIIYHQIAGAASNLANVNFRNKNNRRVVLAIRKEDEQAAISLNFPEANTTLAGTGPDWRMILALEGTPAVFNIEGGILNLAGGLTTDRSLTGPSSPGTLHLYREANPMGLSTKAPRRAWAEGYRSDS